MQITQQKVNSSIKVKKKIILQNSSKKVKKIELSRIRELKFELQLLTCNKRDLNSNLLTKHIFSENLYLGIYITYIGEIFNQNISSFENKNINEST